MSRLRWSAIWIASVRAIWRLGFAAVFAVALVVVVGAGVCARDATIPKSKAIRRVFRIKELSMMKLAKFVKAMCWRFSSAITDDPMQIARLLFTVSRFDTATRQLVTDFLPSNHPGAG